MHGLNFTRKFYAYLLIGIIGVVVDSIVTNISYVVISDITNPQSSIAINTCKTIGAILGAISGIINNFLINDIFVYKLDRNKKAMFLRFVKYVLAVFVGTFIVGKILILNIANHIGFDLWFANLIAIACGMFINYPLNYFWTWKSKKERLIS